MPRIPNLNIAGARILLRNFAGEARRFNAEGNRNFCVALDPETANDLRSDGWSVRQLRPRDDEVDPQDILQVTVSYKVDPPKIVLINGRGKTLLSQDEIHILDWAEIADVDIVINPYQWTYEGRSGIKAYLLAIYVTIAEDEFAKKYYDVPDASGDGD